MIVVTGAAGFIGSCLTTELVRSNYAEVIAVDDFSHEEKKGNLSDLAGLTKIERNKFFKWIKKNHTRIQFIFHLGARTNTAEFDRNLLNALNTEYSKTVWQLCSLYSIPLVYASSAATYGLGEKGFDDRTQPNELKPLNPYGDSKNDFDKWVLKQQDTPPFWMGFKFFNVFGPNEFHKNRMASVVFHAFNQIKTQGKVKLFKSHHPDFKDGEQKRDFIYIKDVLQVLIFAMMHRKDSGIYNLGTGKAGTFLQLATSVFEAMELSPNIEFVPTPEDIRDKYQYYTCADMSKLQQIGYNKPFYIFEDAVKEYTATYLMKGNYY
jgi:ADP-L-glycero-D-manno-heptose 6-epimerase